MSDKQAKILEAATELFIRHGFRRTTLGEIAEAAGMSRPTLYQGYANKEEVFRAVMLHHCREARAAADAGADAASGLEEKLAALFEAWVIEPFKLISSSPEAQELYESTYAFAAETRRQLLQMYEEQLIRVIRSAPDFDPAALEERRLKLKTVAALLARSTLEIKRAATSLAELKRLLAAAARIHAAVLGCK